MNEKKNYLLTHSSETNYLRITTPKLLLPYLRVKKVK